MWACVLMVVVGAAVSAAHGNLDHVGARHSRPRAGSVPCSPLDVHVRLIQTTTDAALGHVCAPECVAGACPLGTQCVALESPDAGSVCLQPCPCSVPDQECVHGVCVYPNGATQSPVPTLTTTRIQRLRRLLELLAAERHPHGIP
jgi:hypothetical protein